MLVRDLNRTDEDIRHLKRLLGMDLTANQKFIIETELRRLTGKSDLGFNPAQVLDFYCADTAKWAVLHNLKLKCNDRIVRIDHLVISNYFDVLLLNTACFYHDLKISVEGEYKLFDGREYQTILSPDENCRQQLGILAEVFNEEILAPTRIGVPLRPKLQAVILMSPSHKVIRPPASILDTSHVIAVNQFIHKLLRHRLIERQGLSKLGLMARYCPGDTLERIAKELAALHQPACIDFAAEMGLDQKLCLRPMSEERSRSGRSHSGQRRVIKPTAAKNDPQPLPQSFDGTS